MASGSAYDLQQNSQLCKKIDRRAIRISHRPIVWGARYATLGEIMPPPLTDSPVPTYLINEERRIC